MTGLSRSAVSAQPAATAGSGSTVRTRRPQATRRLQALAARVGTRRSVVAGVLAAIAGVAGTIAGPFQYRCVAEFGITGGRGHPELLAAYRRELLDPLYGPSGSVAGRAAALPHDVQTLPDRGLLRVVLLSGSPDDGRRRLGAMADDFREHLLSLHRAALGSPGEGEQALIDLLAYQEEQLRSLETTAAISGGASEGPSPLEDRNTLIDALASQRADYESTRRELRSLMQRLDTLRHTPVAPDVAINAQALRKAQDADVELTQDLEALRVQLADIRYQLLRVSEACSSALTELSEAAETARALGESKAARSGTGAFRLAAEKFAEAAQAYESRLSAFSEKWTEQGVTVRQSEPDPRSPGILDMHQRLTRFLGDFLFDTVASLSEMQRQADALVAEPNNAARHHELISQATRSLHSLRTSHHQFEFTASDVRPANNFRLDAALQSAHGLHTRTLARMEAIDAELRRQAYERAVVRRDQEIEQGSRQIDDLRQTADDRVTSILDQQEQLGRATPHADAFIENRASDNEACRLRMHVETTRAKLDALATQRRCPVDPDAVTVIDRSVERTPANLLRRLAWGWLAAATTLLAIFLGQHIVRVRPRR